MTTIALGWHKIPTSNRLRTSLAFALLLITQTRAQTAPANPTPPPGTVIFSRETPTDPDAPEADPPPSHTSPPAASAKDIVPNQDDPLHVTDAERDALTFTAYDLDLHLTPASAGLAARAALTLRNDGPVPLTRLVLQISSSLHWDSLALLTTSSPQHLDFTARRLATDADHTGWAQEAVISLPKPLASGATLHLSALYSGAIPESAERLERIGAPAAEATQTDWDAIAPSTLDASSSSASGTVATAESSGTALRGFGDVLWYPVAAAPVFLGDGAKLFDALGRSKLREQDATMRLRLAVEYLGDPPDAAFFCGHREPLIAHSDNPSTPAAEPAGIATADFAAADSSSSSSTAAPDPGLLAAVTDHYDALPAYSAAAALVQPMLTNWFGSQPLAPLNLIDHPGQPFEDGTLLVRRMRLEAPDALAPSLAHSLTHAWIHSSHPWIEEGLAQFAGLLWIERTQGRAAAIAQLQASAQSLALIEPADPAPDSSAIETAQTSGSSSSPRTAPLSPGQPLTVATSDIYYRSKAAAVWWMLRGIAGDVALKEALQSYRQSLESDPSLDRDPTGLERTIEKFAHKDLQWFFRDWVYTDPGLPDLSIVNVTPRQLEARNGQPAGWLVSVEVRNDGPAEVEVPVTVRAGATTSRTAATSAATETQRLRVPGHSSVSTRIVFPSTPEEVQVNDGGTPEVRTSLHTRQFVLPSPPK
jgi:hypothetical protein